MAPYKAPASLRNKLVADGVYTFVVRIANMAFAAIVGILTARMLGPGGRGIYALPMVDAALVTAAYSGLSTATSFFMLRQNAGRGVFRAAFATLGMFVGAGALITVVIAAIAHHLWACVPAMLSLPGAAALVLVYGYAVGTHRVRINTSLALTNTLVLFSCLVAGFLAIGRTPSAAITAWVVAGDLLGVCVIVWMLRDSRSIEEDVSVGVWEYSAYAIRVGLVSLVSLLNYRADVYIVAIFTDPAMLGMYTLAVAAAETLLAATQVTAVVTMPHVGSMEKDAAARLTARCVRHNVLIASICCGVLALVAPYVVRLLYGAAFTPMVPALRVLLVGVLALSLGSPMSNFFTLRLGKPELPLIFASISASMCIIVSILLVPRMGLIGAAIGSTVAYLTGQTAAIIYFSSISGISAARMLVPQGSDVLSYIDIIGGFARRLRRT